MREYMRARRARDPLMVECEACGVTFSPARTDARFCSDACRARDRRCRVTITEWVHCPDGRSGARCEHTDWTEPGGMTAVPCPSLATWCQQHFLHRERHLIYSRQFCDEHHSGAVKADRKAAVQAYAAHKQQTQPGWLEGNRAGRWSEGAVAEAITWWLRKRHIVEVRRELISP